MHNENLTGRMMAKSKKPAESLVKKYPPRKAVPCFTLGESADEVGQAFGRVITSPELAACRVIQMAESQPFAAGIDVPGLLDVLRNQGTAVNRGNLAQAEVMLINQATALQSLFARLTERAMGAEHMPQLESFLRLALKAQSQCRATLQTLAEIKNPPIVYAKQANIAHTQQVNNGEPSRARENENRPNEPLTVQHGKTLDTFGAGAASGIDPALEAVGTLNRA